jgi:hypothetical protein
MAPQRIAVSATIDQPEGLAGRYLRNGVPVCVAGQRSILLQTFEGGSDLAISQHLDTLAEHGLRKILIFCNARRDVERLTGALRKQGRFRDSIFPHHGSLSQSIRERSEERFLSAPAAVAIATMTLEIGIDIGSVDYVLLAGLPSSVASLLQRIGRGSRRSGKTRAGYTIQTERDRILGEAMFRAARDGRLLGSTYGFRPTVLAQQALVIAASTDWVSAPKLKKLVPEDLWNESGADPKSVISGLIEAQHLEASGSGRAIASDQTQQLYDEGKLHSNLAIEPTVSVIDRLTGEILGTAEIPEFGRLHLAGGSRRIVKTEGQEVLTDGVGGDAPFQFGSKGSPLLSRALARETIESLCREFGRPIDKDELPTFSFGNNLVILHGLGTLGSLLFALVLKHKHGRSSVLESSPLGVCLASQSITLPTFSLQALESRLTDSEAAFVKLTSLGPHHSTLPQSVRFRALRKILDLEGIADQLSAPRLVPLSVSAEVKDRWMSLITWWS